jgi:hypothetical protein
LHIKDCGPHLFEWEKQFVFLVIQSGRIVMRLMLLAGCTVIAMAGGAVAKTPIRDVPAIDDGILWLLIANEIQESCSNITPRYYKALSYLMSLNSKAKSMGYTTEEITAYRRSDAEKARMRVRGEAYARANGADPSKPETLCVLGVSEVQKSSAIGMLLEVK